MSEVLSPLRECSLRDTICCHRISLAYVIGATLIDWLGYRSRSARRRGFFIQPLSPRALRPPVLFRLSSYSREVKKSERGRPVDDISSIFTKHENNLSRNSYYCVLEDFRLFIFNLLCKIYNTDSILEILVLNLCIFFTWPFFILSF